MGHLVCDKCEGCYELEPGESQDDFSNKCECGGKFFYEDAKDNLKKKAVITPCPECGMENIGNVLFCQECGIKIKDNSNSENNNNNSQIIKNNKNNKLHENIQNGSKGKKAKKFSGDKQLIIVGVICCLGLFFILGGFGIIFPEKTTSYANTSNPPSISSDTPTADTSGGILVIGGLLTNTGSHDYTDIGITIRGYDNKGNLIIQQDKNVNDLSSGDSENYDISANWAGKPNVSKITIEVVNATEV